MKNKLIRKITLAVLVLSFSISLITSFSGVSYAATNTALPQDPVKYTRVNFGLITGSDNSSWQIDTSYTEGKTPASLTELRFNKVGSTTEYLNWNQSVDSEPDYRNKKFVRVVSTPNPATGTTATKFQTSLSFGSGNWLDTYYWANKDTIVRWGVLNQFATKYIRDSDGNFYEDTDSACKDSLAISGTGSAIYTARADESSFSGNTQPQIFGLYWHDISGNNRNNNEFDERTILLAKDVNKDSSSSCYVSNQEVGKPANITLTLANNSNLAADQVDPNAPTDTTGQGTLTPDSETLSECAKQLRPFGWILCPVLTFASNIYESFVGVVNSILFFSVDRYEASGLKGAWSVFVRLANVTIVLVGLVMLIGQIFKFEFFSAYTVKKVLPRLFIGAIAIQLSWLIFTVFAQIINALGTGMYWLLLAPFDLVTTDGGMVTFFQATTQNLGQQGGQEIAVNLLGSIAGAVAIGGAVAIAAASGAWVSIIVAMVGVLISVLVALVTIMLREAALIVLLATAPIAIAAWILPATNNIWNMWWKTYSRLLMMYPIIMLLFAGGTIAAHVLSQADKTVAAASVALPQLKIFGVSSGINTYMMLVLEIIVFFAPIFLISMTFKMAGSAFGSVVNMTGKLGSKINSRAGSLGEAGKKSYKGYAANKYQHDPKGRLGRFNNAWARSASGNYLPTRGGAARTAAAGLAYSNQQKQETDTLVASALHGQGYEEQGQTLIKLMAGKDEKVADAARQKAVGTGRIDLVEQSLYTPGTGTKDPTTGKIIGATINDAALKGHYELMRNSSDYGKAVAQQRADLAIDLSDFSDRQVQTTDPITGATTTTTETAVSQYRTALKKTMEKKSADDLLASNDSLYKQTYGPLVPGVDALEFIDQSVIDEIANNSNYRGRLQTSGRDFIESKKSSRSGRP